ncbi:MAG: DNA recombination protein RmuC [Candidatus Pacebacteria bacterium]|nr:DNA recombination protein RmuC [Candidatus Paceibacterota bacterium]
MDKIFLIVIVAGLLFVIFLLLRRKGNGEDNLMLMQRLNEITQVMGNFTQAVDNKLSDSAKMLQVQLSESSKIIQNVTEKLTSLDKTNQQVIGFSEQLNNLSKILTNQKQRGNLGEAGLQLVLENILPPTSFSLQYQFKDGDKVDAVIITKEGLIPVDAKFSLDNYQKLVDCENKSEREILESEFKNDLKKRIDETSKYIKPREGTLEFAFMFIPNEAVYYDLLINEIGAVKVNTRNLIDYAFNDKKVIIISPTTFSAYLLTVLYGLRAFKIEESAKSIRKNVESLGKHIKAYEDFMQKLGTSLCNTVSHYNNAYKELGKIDKDVVRVSKAEPSIEVMELEKPKTEIDAD